MNLEQRLQHAARDLREVQVAVPPLGACARGRPRSRVPAMATPVLVPLLFVAGALFAIGATRPGVDHPGQSDLPAVSESVDSVDSVDRATAVTAVEPGDQPEAPSIDAPSALVEQQLIAEFVSSAQSAKPPTTPDANPVPASEPTGPPVNDIGAI